MLFERFFIDNRADRAVSDNSVAVHEGERHARLCEVTNKRNPEVKLYVAIEIPGFEWLTVDGCRCRRRTGRPRTRTGTMLSTPARSAEYHRPPSYAD